MYPGNTFDNCYQEVRKVAEKEGYANDLFFGEFFGLFEFWFSYTKVKYKVCFCVLHN
jgi:hypothetical protein